MKKSSAVERGELPSEGALDPKVLETIGRALKAHYVELVEAPLPDKFVELLRRLEVEEQSAKARGRRNADD